MTSLSGLNDGDFTAIDVVYTISINGDQGNNNQVLTSNGDTTEYKTIDGSMVELDDLTATGGTILVGGSATGVYDGSVAKSIAVAKVPNALTAGTNITFNTGTTYDGSGAITISGSADNQLALAEGKGIVITDLGGFNRRIATDIDADTIVFDGTEMTVAKVPNALTAGTNISFNTGTTYDGSGAITISATDNNTQLNLTEGNGISISNTGGVNRTIALNADGSTLSNNVGSGQAGVIKVPNGLSAGTNLSLSSGSTFDGATARTVNLDTSISGMINISFNDSGTGTSITGGDYPGALTTTTYLDLSSSTNKIPLPPDVFMSGSDKRMTINLANFMTNDDSTYYNIISEDDGSSKIHGAIKPANAVVEMVGYFIIPNGYSASGVRIDATNASGVAVSRDLTFESFTTYGGTTFAGLGTGVTGSEQSFSSNLTGATDKLLMIRITTTATSDHIRGGYILLV
tara:strand:+ start:338 stop:1717 length:1380 start_codon:yes stop_codon:yes gene_type:complete